VQAVRTLWARVALGANGTSVTLGTLSARIARVALRPERTGRAVNPAVTFGTPSAVDTSTILRVAGAVLIQVLAVGVALAVVVQIPAVQSLRAL